MLYLNSPLAKLLFANRSIHYLGEISYSLHLAHPLFMPIKIRSQPLLDQAIGSASHYVVLIIAVGATILFSIMLYKLVEMPGRRFFSQFSTRKGVLYQVAH